ncbi:hypothetical protein VST7929_03170 [Vibrio stylophorae]|uniref:Uncharacterized protein n=1 Tax=Vibrio stylophorae TaxID=659351 RepID=A0ABM8ZXW0_9VIBR|nr:hypothetical protein [Vibrio stylophorae]CAH0535670.1 hypothetical protein VST7929_03170 [Vibrio stylophorae]
MQHFFPKFWQIIIALSLFTASMAEARVTYPKFSYAYYNTQNQRIGDTNNVVAHAIEQGDLVPLRSSPQLTSAFEQVFASYKKTDPFNYQRFVQDPRLVRAIQQLIGEYACAEYRFRNNLPQAQGCNGFVTNKDTKEHQPFVSGQYQTNDLAVTALPKASSGLIYQITLPSSNKASLSLAWGAIHEMGTFFGRSVHRHQIILTVYIQAFNQKEDGGIGSRITPTAQVIWVILPKASEIGNQKSQQQAAQFAIKNAQMLVANR